MKQIPLTVNRPGRRNLRSHGMVALVVLVVNERVMRHKWHAIKTAKAKTWYAKSGGLLLHRVVMGAVLGDKQEVDHRNRNGLDCQKSNLRFATSSQNKVNTPPRGRSNLKGVRFKANGWEATIKLDGKSVYLGRFSTSEQASNAYNQRAVREHGQFAYQQQGDKT